METKPPATILDGPPSPQEEKQEVHVHRRALLRGRGLIAAGIGLLGIFGVVTLAALFIDPRVFDAPITREVQEMQVGPLSTLLIAVSAPGFQPWNFVFPLVIMGGLAFLRRLAEAAFLGLAAGVSATDEIVKALVHRSRPSADLVLVIQHLDSYSFPSGHVTEYTLVFGFCFYLAFTLMKHGALRTLVLIGGAAMVLLVGPSRVWMGQHWASDVLGGYALGFALLLGVIWGYRGWELRRVAGSSPLPQAGEHAIMTPTAQK